MDDTILRKALDSCGNDINLAIQSLNGLRLNSNDQISSIEGQTAPTTSGAAIQGERSEANEKTPEASCSRNGEETQEQRDAVQPGPATMAAEEWVELVVREMMTSSDLDDARVRAARVLEAFEKAVQQRGTDVAPVDGKEVAGLRDQMVKLSQDNNILKRAVATYHSRQQEHEGRGRELQQLKQLLSQYQEQLRSLEVTNYALNLHLKTAQQASSMPSRFHPDVF